MSETAIVTGASSGIGAATVAALRHAGFDVHALARRADRLEALAAATGCEAHVVDVNDTPALERLLGAIEADVLVNNAGLGRAMDSLAEASFDDIERTVATNVTAVLHATRIVLPGMIARRRGHIVNLGSMAGLYPLSAALYGATKGAVHRLSTNLRLELRGTGVRVTEVCPGRVVSEFYDVVIARIGRRPRPAVATPGDGHRRDHLGGRGRADPIRRRVAGPHEHQPHRGPTDGADLRRQPVRSDPGVRR